MTELQNLQDQIIEIFTKIEEASSIEELKSIQNQDQYAHLKKYDIPESKYPRLGISLTTKDIDILKEKNLLDKDGLLSMGIAKNDPLSPLSPLEKLLYSILWKSGDLVKHKEKHIHDGVFGREDKKNALVFYYFGKHLADKSNPIIDQHVIRAWLSFQASKNKFQNIEKILSKKDVTRKDKEACQEYIDWQNNHKLKKVKPIEFTYYVDRLLFAFGKYLKGANLNRQKVLTLF
jgi:hypothetical protein